MTNDVIEPLKVLTTRTEHYVDLSVSIKSTSSNGATVESNHTYQDGTSRPFKIEWPNTDLENTEYGLGISLIHDLKDHYFWGLDISQMAEFQVICQIQVGRAMLTDAEKWLQRAQERINDEIDRELYGPRWPRVYDPSVPPLLKDNDAAEEISDLVRRFCFDIVVPRLAQAYRTAPELLMLQRSVLEMPELAQHFLADLRWKDRERQTAVLAENLGFSTGVRAYANRRASDITNCIFDQWASHIARVSLHPEWFSYLPISRRS